MSEGWVYVLSNRSIKKQVKIGYSTISPESRARDLDTTGVPTPFKVEYEIKVKNCELLEKKVHEKLSSKRVRKGREFFRIDIQTVISVIQDLADDQKLEDKVHYKSPEEIQKAKIVRVTESVGRKNVLEIKNEIACRVNLTHKKLSERINQLNREFKKVSSGIAIFSAAKKDKEQKLRDLEFRISGCLALLNRLILKNYFWEKYITDSKFESYSPKPINEFEALLDSDLPIGAIIVNDLFPSRVKLQISYSRVTLMAGSQLSSQYDYIGLCMKYAFFVKGSKRFSGAFNDAEMLKFYRGNPIFDIKNCWNENFWKP